MDDNYTNNTEEQLNQEAIEAMLEAERIAHDPHIKGYTDINELLNDLES